MRPAAVTRMGRSRGDPRLRVGSRLGKYRITRLLAEGGFARVYAATDTIEGLQVALKVPRSHAVDDESLAQFRREVRTHATLDHANVLPIKNADLIDGRLVVAVPLGDGALHQRLRKRLSTRLAWSFSTQLIEALAHVHEHRIVHCDVKPENLLLFGGDQLRLADFGIAKVVQRSIKGSGSGTLGYMAPEHAMGRPGFPADVFAAGLVIWRMFTGELPEWPFTWPLPGTARLRRKLPAEAIELLRRALDVDPRKRFADAGRMLVAWRRVEPAVLRSLAGRPGARKRRAKTVVDAASRWREARFRQFRRVFGRALGLKLSCGGCGGPLSEAMRGCPWCGTEPRFTRDVVASRYVCPRCGRSRAPGAKSCAFCWGPSFDEADPRRPARGAPRCGVCHTTLPHFARYCPGCRRKVTRRWRFEGADGSCRHCIQPVVAGAWTYCPWCRGRLGNGRS